MSNVVSVRLSDEDILKLDSLGDRREILTKAIHLYYLFSQMNVYAKDESIQAQSKLEGVVSE